MSEIETIKQQLRIFARDRDWDKFHSPKNLVMALSVEVSELVEYFQWLTESQSKSLSEDAIAKVAEEIADVQVYLIRLADKLNVDIINVIENKIKRNKVGYPADKVRGSASKFTEYDAE